MSGVAVDTPDRIIVGVWGDRSADGQPREGGTNYLVVADRDGNIVERWTQWDSILNKPHQIYISPYDPERHVWVVERGGGRDVHMQILKFINDGSELVMQLVDPDHPTTRAERRDPARLCGWLVATAPARRRSGRQRVCGQLGRWVAEQVRPEA